MWGNDPAQTGEEVVAAAEGVWKVVQFVGAEKTRMRTVFEGIEKDARDYISRHFPRVHLEPNSPDEPQPDAVVLSPSGAKESYDATNGFTPVDDGGKGE